jgi:hypothetical protein
MQTPRRGNLVVALLCIALGSFLALVAGGLIEDDPAKRHAPDLIIGLSGSVFVIAGIMILVGRQSRFNDLLAAILCMTFGIIGAWVSIFGASEGFSGGLPLISDETNTRLARAAFGLGALLCFAISAWAFKRYYRPAE